MMPGTYPSTVSTREMKNSGCTIEERINQQLLLALPDVCFISQLIRMACGGEQNAYAAAAVAEEDDERREHDGEDDLEARRATAGIAHPVVGPRLALWTVVEFRRMEWRKLSATRPGRV
jgi:hypothetical protein